MLRRNDKRAHVGVRLRRIQPRVAHRQGAALVELSIILFLLVIIVFGCVDFGRFALTSIAVNNAARAGASAGSMNPFTPLTRPIWEEAIRQAVINEISGIPGFREDRLSVDPPEIHVDESAAMRVRVNVAYPFEPVVPWLVIPDQFTVARTVEMRVIR